MPRPWDFSCSNDKIFCSFFPFFRSCWNAEFEAYYISSEGEEEPLRDNVSTSAWVACINTRFNAPTSCGIILSRRFFLQSNSGGTFCTRNVHGGLGNVVLVEICPYHETTSLSAFARSALWRKSAWRFVRGDVTGISHEKSVCWLYFCGSLHRTTELSSRIKCGNQGIFYYLRGYMVIRTQYCCVKSGIYRFLGSSWVLITMPPPVI